jgi:tetratricopeptide (TPR) repeat protein
MSRPNTPISSEKETILKEAIRASPRSLGDAPTELLNAPLPNAKGPKPFRLRWLLLLMVLYFAYETSEEGDLERKPRGQAMQLVMPNLKDRVGQPKESSARYLKGARLLLFDHLESVRQAVPFFLESLALDPKNSQALARLIQCYLRLVSAGLVKSQHFSMIAALVEVLQKRGVALPETVMAEADFFASLQNFGAALQKIEQYVLTHPDTSSELLWKIASFHAARYEYTQALGILNQITDKQLDSPRIPYLRGLLHEGLKDTQTAILHYQQALKLYPGHVNSTLALLRLAKADGKLGENEKALEFLITLRARLDTSMAAEAWALLSEVRELRGRTKDALQAIGEALKLRPEKRDYQLQQLSLRARVRGADPALILSAKMNLLLSQAERWVQSGQYQEAMIPLLEARHLSDEDPLPLEKLGDLFRYQGDFHNAVRNYRFGLDRAPKDVRMVSKLIHSYIQSYELEEAEKLMKRFRALPVSQSVVDKAAGDIYLKQQRYKEASVMYQKALKRKQIDESVYLQYGKALTELKKYQEAAFYVSRAKQLDPFNTEAVLLLARIFTETESIQRGIEYLRHELIMGGKQQADLLSALAEYQLQEGQVELARATIEEAKNLSPQAAAPWRVQALIEATGDLSSKRVSEKVLRSYESYTERSPSSVLGYLERYKVFARRAEFEKAQEELVRVHQTYPKYPRLHYYFGVLYSVQNNHQAALQEFEYESKVNPSNLEALDAAGKSYMELGQAAEALKVYNRVMQKDPTHPGARFGAGWAHYQLKNYDAAVALFLTGLKIQNSNPLMYKRLALIYVAMAQPVLACDQVREYLKREPDAVDKAELPDCGL